MLFYYQKTAKKYKKNKYCIWYLKKIIVLKKLNRQKREFAGFIGAGEGIRIHHSLQVFQIIQRILIKLYCNSIALLP